MTPAEVLARVQAAGIQSRPLPDERIGASPREALTDELRTLIRANKSELLTVLARTPEPVHAHGPEEHPEPAPAHMQAPDHGADCMRCANLTMRVETHPGIRRAFWWRCEKGHALMEGRNFGERVLLAPTDCDRAGDFRQWTAGQR